MQVSSIANHPQRAEIDAALANGETFRKVAQRFGVSVSGLHRHASKVPERPRDAANSNLSERELRRFVRASRRFLEEQTADRPACEACGFQGRDWKAIQAAIVAGTKAISEWGKSRKEIGSGSSVSVSLSQLQVSAIEAHERVRQAPTPDLLKHAGSCLGAHVLRSDPLALRILADLNALAQRRSSATVEE